MVAIKALISMCTCATSMAYALLSVQREVLWSEADAVVDAHEHKLKPPVRHRSGIAVRRVRLDHEGVREARVLAPWHALVHGVPRYLLLLGGRRCGGHAHLGLHRQREKLATVRHHGERRSFYREATGLQNAGPEQ